MALPPLVLLTSLLSQIGHCAYVNMGIVNGSVVKAHSRPYMVSVQKDGKHRCGGFLVSENFVMTAAHCWNPGMKLTVVLGAHDLKKGRSALIRTEVKLYHIHPMYNSENLLGDIMLLQLNKTIKKTKGISWITIPKKLNQDVKANQVCSIAGWGKQSDNGRSSDLLMEADVTVIDTKICEKEWGEPFSVSSVMCSKNRGGFCQGDSGGPLVCKNTAVGIVSFYEDGKCKTPRLPYVYTKISKYLPWINCILGRMEGMTLTIVAGAHDLKKDWSTLIRTEVKLYHIHPKYDSKTLLNDIMLLQVGCELEEKERFCSELDEVIESIPTGERVVIGADFNGHVGKGNTGDEEVMGKFGVKEMNLEGQMVVDFAKRMDMAVVNTYFQKREEHRVT
ncbi:hypothetical protein QTP70_023434 [Hemibagrus guttatus]|uniref:trypsin n=1 Tax=Hemibagrus guttatus TaxID=175788 RepID=A0AAE0V0P4_9TELE|nr:hypothetical protein QTP70_023434 [Hemibagrus guttatus]